MAISVVEFLLAGFTDNSGNPLAGGKVYTYSPGTTTAKSVYTDKDGTTPETNPVILDANGRKQVYALGAYKFVVKTALDVTLYTFDNLFFDIGSVTTHAEMVAANSAGTEIFIKTAVTLTANITLTSPLRIQKGGSIITAGFTLTVNGPLIAEKTTIFTAAKNQVLLGSDSCVEAYPEWWGAVGDGTTNDCDALRCAIGAFKRIFLSESTYLISGTAGSGDFMLYLGIADGTTERDGMMIYGTGHKSIIKLGSAVGNSKLLFGGATGDTLSDMIFRDFKIDLNGSNNLQVNFNDPLRYNSAFYLSCYCENLVFDNLFIDQASGSQVIRVGNDLSGGVGKNIKVLNCIFDTFGIGLTNNHTQDVSVLYIEARDILVQNNFFRNANFTFDLSRGHTAVELHGQFDTKVIGNTFEYMQLPILYASVFVDTADVLIEGNIFRETNYMVSLDASTTGQDQNRINICNNIFWSTKSNSHIIPIGNSTEGARGRAQINFKNNIMSGIGNIAQRTHIFAIENSYIDSLVIAENDISSFKGCLVYFAGPALPDGLGEIVIANNRLDSLGPDDGGTFPGNPCFAIVAPTSNNLKSLIITGNHFFNTQAKDYSIDAILRRSGDIDYVYIAENHYHMVTGYTVLVGSLGTVLEKFEQYTSAGNIIQTGALTLAGNLVAAKLGLGNSTLQTGQLARIYAAASGATKPTNAPLEVESDTNIVVNVSVPNANVGGFFVSTPTGALRGGIEWDETNDLLNLYSGAALRASLDASGKPILNTTVTAGGTTGAQTINKASGTVNFAAGASSLVVTCSVCTTSSLVFAEVRTNDTTAIIKSVVPAAGSFTIRLNAAATAETSVGFLVVN